MATPPPLVTHHQLALADGSTWRAIRCWVVKEVSHHAHLHAGRAVPVFVAINAVQSLAPAPGEPELASLCNWLAQHGIGYRVTSGWVTAHTLEVSFAAA